MYALWCTAGALAVAAAVNLSPALAQGRGPSGSGAAGVFRLADPETAKVEPHCEWQYHYAGRHAHWEGHWVFVKPPVASIPAAATGGKL